MNEAASAALTGVSLRPLEDTDRDFLYQVYAASREREMALVSHWSAAEKTTFLREQFRLQHAHYQAHYPDARFDIIMKNTEPVGRLYVATVGDEMRLMDIALLPAWRGAGIGGALIRTLLAAANDTGRWLSLHVEPDNPARRLYLRLGFVDVETVGVYTLMHWRGGSAAPANTQVNTAS